MCSFIIRGLFEDVGDVFCELSDHLEDDIFDNMSESLTSDFGEGVFFFIRDLEGNFLLCLFTVNSQFKMALDGLRLLNGHYCKVLICYFGFCRLDRLRGFI